LGVTVPFITVIHPASGHTSGRNVVELRGLGYQTWVIPPPQGRPADPPWATVEVLFGGSPAFDVQVLSDHRLFARVPPSPILVAKPTYGEGLVDVTVRNLTQSGIPIAGETFTLPAAYQYQRSQLAEETDYARLVREVVRLLRRDVISNVASGAHTDYDLDPSDLLNVVDVADLPAVALFGPALIPNRSSSVQGYVYGKAEGYEADAFNGPDTDDLLFTFVGISDQKQEALSLQAAVRQFFKRNKWIGLARDPKNLGLGSVAYDLVLESTGLGFGPPPDQKSNLHIFSGSFTVRCFDHEGLASHLLSDRIARVHQVTEDPINPEPPLPLPPTPVPSNEKTIVSFAFPDGVGVIGSGTIAVTVPFGTDVTGLIPTITHTGVSVLPADGIPQDFTVPVTYTVFAVDGSEQDYVVTVIVRPADMIGIQSFELPQGAGEINGTSIEVVVPQGTDRTALVPTIAFLGVSISPPTAVAADFSGVAQWQWDEEELEEWKQYSFGGDDYISYVGAVETAASRFGLVSEFNLAGIAFWVLGREDGRIYDRLRTRFAAAGTDLQYEVAGWYNDGWNAESHASYMANWEVFSEINPYWYDLGTQDNLALADGTISERAVYDAQNVLDAHARGDLVIPTIADHAGQIDAILGNPTARQTLIDNLVNTVQTRGYDGIDLNFESGSPALRSAFTAFVSNLATAMHASSKRLVVTMKPAANSTRENQLIFDYAALAAIAVDRFKIMVYDNLDPAVPGPVAPISWMREVLAYATIARGLPSTKIQLAIHAHAWTWRDNGGTWELQEPHDTYRDVNRRAGAVPYTVTGADSSTRTFDVSVTYPIATVSSAMKIGTNFWYHTRLDNNWSGEEAMIPGINWATAYGPGTNGIATANIWNPVWIAELAPYSCLRFMDWGNTNWSQIVNWADRMLPTDPNNYEVYNDGGSTPPNPGMAYEWMIDLCNRTQKDLWICLPAMADSNYRTQLATLIHDKLQPNLRVYVEYSNETWNGAFGQFQYTIDQGIDQNLPGDNQWYQGQSYTALQAIQIFDAFEEVFGFTAMGQRVIRVFAFGGNMDTGRQALRDVYQSSTYNPNAQLIDFLAFAPYLGYSLDGTSGTIQTQFRASIDALEADELAFAIACKEEFEIPVLGTYEGGQSLYANSKVWSENPAIYDEYRYMLDRWSQHFALFMHYTHTGRWTNAAGQSSWGALDHTGQPLAEAHKYRAIVDWVAANP
jgi:hypothetical protein